jgi:hypothetical protein
MPKRDQTRKVSPIPNEPFRFLVESWEIPDQPHVVDLLAYGGNSQCSCKSFAIDKTDAIKRGRPLFTEETICCHGWAARDYLINEILKDQSSAQLNPDA